MSKKLEPNQIHLYSIDLRQSAEVCTAKRPLLSPDEVSRAERYQFDHLRQRFILCRGYLRELLGAYLDQDPTNLHFQYTDKEKPYLPPPSSDQDPLSFNVSHSEDIAVMAFAWKTELGIDVESLQRKTDIASIAKRYFSTLEFEQFLAVPEEQRIETFYNGWTAKEAFIKAKGQGLSLDLSSFAIEARPGHDPRLLSVSWDPPDAEKWHFYRFRPQADAVATLAYEAPHTKEILLQTNLP